MDAKRENRHRCETKPKLETRAMKQDEMRYDDGTMQAGNDIVLRRDATRGKLLVLQSKFDTGRTKAGVLGICAYPRREVQYRGDVEDQAIARTRYTLTMSRVVQRCW